jgi:hypothetical protein
MRSRPPEKRLLALILLVLAALVAAGCGGAGTTVGPGGVRASGANQGAGGGSIVGFDPRNGPLGCILANKIQAQKDPRQPDRIDILPATSGASIAFASTAAEAQDRQLADDAPGAEVIGPALLTVGTLSDAELNKVESCLQAQGTRY